MRKSDVAQGSMSPRLRSHVPRRGLRLSSEQAALSDLEATAEWSPSQAKAVVDAMERMAQVGWSLGRATDYLDVR